MFATTENRDRHLVLLPAGNGHEASDWSGAALDYAVAFGGILFRREVSGLRFSDFSHVTIVKPEAWPKNLTETIVASNPAVVLDLIPAPNPEALRAMLNTRVFHGWRYGPLGQKDWNAVWPAGACLAGLHGRADGEMQEEDYAVVQAARIEAVKITSHATMDTVAKLRAIRPNLFIMVRPIVAFEDQGQPRRITPREFVEWTSSDLARLYDADPAIRYFEVHNEPNLRREGLEGSWNNGVEFGRWFLEVVNLYRQRFPRAKFGFPGLSLGPAMASPQRADWKGFLDQATSAANLADWIGVHCYWVNESEMLKQALGYAWLEYRLRFPEKLLFITEFGNPWQPKAVVAQQYARYYRHLRGVDGLGAAFAYVVSTSSPEESRYWAWRDEKGSDLGIAQAVSGR